MNKYDTEKQFVVSVDRENVKGPVKPLHGVNNAPYYFGDTDKLHYLKEAHIPYSRLHDTCGPYGGSRFVDVENIFRDFDADETDPANYDFAATDHLLTNLVANGAEPFYRLGCTIENTFSPRKTRRNGQGSANILLPTTTRAGETASASASRTGRSGTSRTTSLSPIRIRCGAGQWKNISNFTAYPRTT